MKTTKQMKPSTTRETNAGTSIFKKNSSVLQGSSSSNAKIKRKIRFLANESEPLILIPPSSGESMVKYSLRIPSENKHDVVDELQMLKDITDHLNELVHTMEYVYAKKVEEEEEEEEEEDKESSIESFEDMTTFLLCFSSVATQLETAFEEEKKILESLLKWFGKVVQQMEELGEDELVPDWQLPLADKDITNNIAKLVQCFQKLEELKDRVQDLPKSIQIPAARQEKKKRASPVSSSHRDPKAILEDLVMKHGTEDVVSMAHALEDDLTPQTIETMSTRILDIMKVFERQTNKLQRISNEQDVLEGKYQKIQNEYQLLAEEKQIMEIELQKMREEEKLGKEKIIPESRKRFLSKLERKQPGENAEVSSESGVQAAGYREARQISVTQIKKESENQKMKEDLIKAKENLQVLEREKKNLEEKLQKALEEAVKANRQLTQSRTPSFGQDTQLIYPEAVEENAGTDLKVNDKDSSKKGKLSTKSKGKGEDHTFSRRKSVNGTDKSVQKLPAVDTGKQTVKVFSRKTPVEIEKNEETVTSQLEDVKPEKKVVTDKENSKDYGSPASRLKEKVHVPEREQLYKTKESDGVMEEIPELQFPQPGHERVQHIPRSADKEPIPLLPVKIKEESKGKKAQTEEKTETPLKLDLKGSTKPKKAAETKKGNVMRKSTGKETHSSAVSDLSQLRKVQEESPLDSYSNSQDKSLPRSLDKLISARQEKTSPKVSQTNETQVEASLRSSTQGEDPSLFTYKNQILPSIVTPKVQVPFKDLLPSHKVSSADFAKVKEESQTTPISPIEKTHATISSKILGEGSALFIPEDKIISTITSSVKEDRAFLGEIQEPVEVYQDIQLCLQDSPKVYEDVQGHKKGFHKDQKVGQEDIQRLLKDHETIILEKVEPIEKSLPRIYKEAVDLKEDLSDTERLPLKNQLKCLNDMQQAQTVVLEEAGQNIEKKEHEQREQRWMMAANLKANLHDTQQAQALSAGQEGKYRPDERQAPNELETKKLSLTSLESTLKDLQEAEASVACQPVSVGEKDVNDLSEKRRLLLTTLNSNLKDLQQGEALAASQPDSMNEKKVYELTKQRRILASSLDANLQDLQEAHALAASQEVKYKPVDDERKIYELSETRKLLLASLESNLKDLQQAQALQSSQPSSMIESKVKELTKKREMLVAKLEANLKDLQQAQVFPTGQIGKEKPNDSRKTASHPSNLQTLMSVSSLAGLLLTSTEPSGSKMSHSEKRRLLPERQPLSNKSVQLAHTLSALLPQDRNAKNEMEQIMLRKRLPLANLPSAFPYAPSPPTIPPLHLSLQNVTENEIREILDKKRHLPPSQQFNVDYLSQAEALAQSQLQQSFIGREAQQLPGIEISQKKRIVKKSSITHSKDLDKGTLQMPQDTKKESLCISGKGYNALTSRSSELRKEPKHY